MCIDSQILDRLDGLPAAAVQLYFLGLLPLANAVGEVGEQGSLTWNRLARRVEVDPRPGISGVRYRKDQLRRILRWLERAGLVENHSLRQQLRFRLPFHRKSATAESPVVSETTVPAPAPAPVLPLVTSLATQWTCAPALPAVPLFWQAPLLTSWHVSVPHATPTPRPAAPMTATATLAEAAPSQPLASLTPPPEAHDDAIDQWLVDLLAQEDPAASAPRSLSPVPTESSLVTPVTRQESHPSGLADPALTRDGTIPDDGPHPSEALVPTTKPRRKRNPDITPEQTRPVWQAYRDAFFSRYQVEPPRNAKVNSQINQLVKKIGAKAIPLVRFYVEHGDIAAIRCRHVMDLLLKRTETYMIDWERYCKDLALYGPDYDPDRDGVRGSDAFEAFWKQYPNARSKPQAWDAWQLRGCDRFVEAILHDLTIRPIQDGYWRDGIIPTPEKYLLGQQWNDPVRKESFYKKTVREKNEQVYQECLDAYYQWEKRNAEDARVYDEPLNPLRPEEIFCGKASQETPKHLTTDQSIKNR